jgi:hypothetical protein
MALKFDEFKQSPSWYIMFLCLSSVGFMYTKGIYDDKINKKESYLRETECKTEVKYYQLELSKTNSKVDSLHRIIGYLNGVNQTLLKNK